MHCLIVLTAILASAVAAPAPGIIADSAIIAPAPALIAPAPALGATLLPRVAVAPAQTTIVKQPVIVEQPTPVLRSVPVPLRAISYASPYYL